MLWQDIHKRIVTVIGFADDRDSHLLGSAIACRCAGATGSGRGRPDHVGAACAVTPAIRS
jgi:hypothetical protein